MIDRIVNWAVGSMIALCIVTVLAIAALGPILTRKLAAECNDTGGIYTEGICQHPKRTAP